MGKLCEVLDVGWTNDSAWP